MRKLPGRITGYITTLRSLMSGYETWFSCEQIVFEFCVQTEVHESEFWISIGQGIQSYFTDQMSLLLLKYSSIHLPLRASIPTIYSTSQRPFCQFHHPSLF